MAAGGELLLRPGERGRLELERALKVAAWVQSEEPRAEAMQVVAAQWALRSDMGGFATYDAAGTDGLNTRGYFGAVWDGRYVYYVPYTNKVVVRCDTQGEFQNPGSWEAHDAGHTSGLKTRGYDGAAFDGRYLYFIPFWEGEDLSRGFHARLLRYDSGRAFKDPGSWQAKDAGDTIPPSPGGFNGGAFDGRFLYLAPWREGTGPEGQILPHGKVLRCDTADPSSCFILKYMDCGHNGGLGAALGGPSLMVNASGGVRSARTHRNPGPGWHHLAGVYDGERIALFLDGEEVARGEGGGRLAGSRMEVEIGGLDGGHSRFRGQIAQVRLAAAAWPASQMRAAYQDCQKTIER
jgi:hypothetical protein